jgi:phage virion morphogenesis protein
VNDELTQLETWAGALLAKLLPPERRRLAGTIAQDLRRSQQKRIAAQQAPDGTPYDPRKRRAQPLRRKKGAINRKKDAMFAKLRMARWLKASATAEGAEVGFTGRVARLARVHQYGLNDRPVHQYGLNDRPDPGAKDVRYPRRVLLGFTEADRVMVRERLLEHLSD